MLAQLSSEDVKAFILVRKRSYDGIYNIEVVYYQVLNLSPQHHDCLILGSASLLRGPLTADMKGVVST